MPLLLLPSSFFGGCVGSTCGGIKAIRFLLLYKQSVRNARLLIRPTAQIAVKLGDHPVPNRVMQVVWAFYFHRGREAGLQEALERLIASGIAEDQARRLLRLA